MLVVLTTLSSKKEAKKLVKALLEKRLIVCDQRSKIKSTYLWQGQVCKEKEYLLSLKTLKERFSELEKQILVLHPYKVPQIIALEARFVSKAYFKWARKICL